jgi:hypothetical protein
MTMLVTLAQAKKHLYIDGDDHDEEVIEKIEEASGAVISYLKDGAEEFLDSSNLLNIDTSGNVITDSPAVFIPFQIRAATLQMLTALWENRGDDGGEKSKFAHGYLPPSVTALLYPLRDPAIA